MNKKLIALAIASAFASPGVALAQGSSVTIYGTLNVDFENVERDDSTSVGQTNSFVTSTGIDFKSRNRLTSNSSNVGFRGTEDLGNGLKGIFQVESSLNIDTGGGNLGGRNSNVGLSGPWGTVFYGLWDTPYKFVSLRQDSWYATGIGAGHAILGTPGFGVVTATQSAPGAPGTLANAGFDIRRGDSVQYWSPSWNGLSFRLMYSANEAKTADDIAIETDPFTYSGAIVYENGPLYVNLAAERHEDYFGLTSLAPVAAAVSAANDSSQDTGYKFGIGYTFGNTTLNFIYEHLDYENDAGVITDYDRDAFFLGLLHKIGAWTIRGIYVHADEGDCSGDVAGCDSDDLGADFYSIGASYSFSKRTDVYAIFVLVDAEDLSAYNFGIAANLGGPGAQAGGPANNTFGAQARAVGLGIRHAF